MNKSKKVWICSAVDFFYKFIFFNLIPSILHFTKKYFEQIGVILVFFFNNDEDDAVKVDKTIFTSHYAAEPLVSHSVSYIFVKLDMDPEL